MISAYNSYNEPYQIICIPASTLLAAHSPHLPLKVSYFTTSRFDIYLQDNQNLAQNGAHNQVPSEEQGRQPGHHCGQLHGGSSIL